MSASSSGIEFKKGFDPDAMRRFARKVWFVKDPDKMERVLAVYADWFHNRKRVTVHINPNTKEGEVDTCLEIPLAVRGDETTSIYISHRKEVERFVWRQQTIKPNSELYGLSALEIAKKTHHPRFGQMFSSGKYIHGMNIYDDLASKRLKRLHSEYQRDSFETLLGRVEAALQPDTTSNFSSWDYRLAPLSEHVAYLENQEMRRAKREFLKTLDSQALKILYRARLPDSYLYSWLMGHRESARHEEDVKTSPNFRNRQDAAYAYPWLLPSFAYNAGRAITKNLDAGMPVPDAIIHSDIGKRNWNGEFDTPITKEVLRWALGRKHTFVENPQKEHNPNIYHTIHELPWLGGIPREYRPRDRKEYRAFRTLKYGMSDFENYLGRPNATLTREFLAALNRPEDLPKFPHRTEEGETILKPIFEAATPVQAFITQNTSRHDSIFLMSSNMKDALNSIENQILLPEVINRMIEHGMREDLAFSKEETTLVDVVSRGLMPHIFGKYTVLKMFSFSERWHLHTNDLERRTGRIDKMIEWAPLINPVISPHGVHVHAECTSEGLKKLGNKKIMNNCVGKYAYQCTVGKSHIIVLRDPDKVWMTNMELVETYQKDGCRGVVIEQHSGKGNDTNIPRAARAAADWLVQGINSGAITVDWQAIDAGRAALNHEKMILKVGFDPENKEACDNAYKAWHGTMRDIFPDPTRDAFMARSGLRAAVDNNIARVLKGRRRNNPGPEPQLRAN